MTLIHPSCFEFDLRDQSVKFMMRTCYIGLQVGEGVLHLILYGAVDKLRCFVLDTQERWQFSVYF